MSLVHNEQTKLTANALDRASTACLTVGVLGPSAAALYGLGSAAAGGWIGFGALLWLAAAGLLHSMARRTLRSLR
ncbi:hypothetical protein D9R14_05200 [Xanthobacter tagetidis]|uniref:Amino acid transporter n=1 Tax=Xanthobacter tagetidis TaxID=60216 RepID=A0A3L7AK36_9HYPH|nr:hypothetical protein D9R14_05200 [Xanthobacter tagetidis]